MGRVVVRHREELESRRAADTPEAERPARYAEFTPEQLATSRAQYFPVGEEGLQLLEIHVEPSTEIHPHAHTQSEIIYVTAGEIQLGAQRCGPGTAIYIDADTL
jgi:quercetin dioxygenase-like cupin family protein